MADKEITRLHAVVEGMVQGVGFRNFVQENAYRLNLTGWVRNRWDGTVEVTAEGDRQDLEKLLQALRRGPRASTVSGVRPEWQDATGEFEYFKVKMSLM
jgi:acylphosphatase